MKKINTKVKRLRSDEFLETMKRIKIIDKEIIALSLERELLVYKVKPGKK
ncbi:MAG: hypothetical protein HOE19_03545 [Candidatus Komeilibacteria bacterium]|jgi:hypothetical protein|nr:hypothetical protein [Candidatus Komeilibacteria bacterium]MBT4447750.1 hypothetical protein [Candidatus Komeilibacteria bacterium]